MPKEPKSVNLSLKNVPTDLYEQLKKRAGQHRRSMNNEIVHMLDQTIQREQDEERLMKNIADLKSSMNWKTTDEEIQAAKIEGRK